MLHHALLVLNKDGLVYDSLWDLGGVITYQIDEDGVLQSLFGKFLDESGNGCREDHAAGAFLTCKELLNLYNVLLKAHVKHFVALIKDLILAVIHVETLILEQVNQPARCAQQHIRAHLLYVTHLLATGGTATVD